MIVALAFAAYVATIPLANWMVGNVGMICAPGGPCLIPVGFGLMAPTAVVMVGLALVLRDAVHSLAGGQWALMAILAGAVLSVAVAPPALVIASTAAFLLSELADFAIYAPLRKRRLYTAVMLSGFVGAVVDSIVFLSLAFGSLDFAAGQVVGKLWMSLLALPVIAAFSPLPARIDMSKLTETRRRADDPDETEGRRLYRAHADARARMDVSIAARRVRYDPPAGRKALEGQADGE